MRTLLFLSLIVFFIMGCKEESPLDDKKSQLIVAFGDSHTRGSNPKNPNNTGAKGYLPYLQGKFPKERFVNCGIGGQTTRDAKSRYSEIILGNYTNCTMDNKDTDATAALYDYTKYQGLKPDIILLWLGANDVLKNEPDQRETLANLRWYVSEAKKQKISIVISLIPPYEPTSFYPMIDEPKGEKFHRVRTVNALIEQVAKENDLIIVDPFTPFKDTFAQYTWDNIHMNSDAYKIVGGFWEKALKKGEGKKPFIDTKASCLTASGYQIPDYVVVCSCASGATGELWRCDNGEFKFLYTLNSYCQDAIYTNHNFIAHHCDTYPKK